MPAERSSAAPRRVVGPETDYRILRLGLAQAQSLSEPALEHYRLLVVNPHDKTTVLLMRGCPKCDEIAEASARAQSGELEDCDCVASRGYALDNCRYCNGTGVRGAEVVARATLSSRDQCSTPGCEWPSEHLEDHPCGRPTP